MAFDVYAGTMTRFYRGEWENVAQRMTREQGGKYTMIYAGGEPPPPPPADEIREVVLHWCRALSSALATHGVGPIAWSEDDDVPYFTDRPAWPGYTALLVWAAHAEHPNLPLPSSVPDSWLDDPAFQRSIKPEFKTNYGTILDAQLWLPAEFLFVFEFPTLTSEKGSRIGSAFTLRRQLDQLKGKTSEKLSAKTELAQTASSAIECFRTLVEMACEHQVPILLSY
jgi:hypothetical protein